MRLIYKNSQPFVENETLQDKFSFLHLSLNDSKDLWRPKSQNLEGYNLFLKQISGIFFQLIIHNVFKNYIESEKK